MQKQRSQTTVKYLSVNSSLNKFKNTDVKNLYLSSSTGELLVVLADGGGESKETKSIEYDADEVDDCVLTLFRREVGGGGLIKGTLGSPAKRHKLKPSQF